MTAWGFNPRNVIPTTPGSAKGAFHVAAEWLRTGASQFAPAQVRHRSFFLNWFLKKWILRERMLNYKKYQKNPQSKCL